MKTPDLFGHEVPPASPAALMLRWLSFVEKSTGKDACWLWRGATSKGYGLMSAGRRGSSPLKAHRLSYEWFKGPIPAGMVVRHSCDNPSCVNPHHLSIGTQSDNMLDASKRGRLNAASLGNLRPGAPGHYGAGPTPRGKTVH